MKLRLTRFPAAAAIAATLFTADPSASQPIRVFGAVIDAETYAPLPGVNVFVANTTLGAATGTDGTFQIEIPHGGTIEVVASMVGYHPQSITVSHLLGVELEFRLRERTFSVPEAIVTATRPHDWKRNLERFTREFLGTSDNAQATRIINPHVLDFLSDPEAGTMQAFASEPLRIENRALGYDLVFVLDDFVVSDHPYSIRYRGSPRFTDRKGTADFDSVEVERRRRTAYDGSFRHFLVALTRNALEAEGFDVRSAGSLVSRRAEIPFLPSVAVDDLVADGQSDFERQFYWPEILHVTYREEREDPKFGRFVRERTGSSGSQGRKQVSFLRFHHGTTVHATGYLYEPYAVETHGYWAWERVADMVPRDYRPNLIHGGDGITRQ